MTCLPTGEIGMLLRELRRAVSTSKRAPHLIPKKTRPIIFSKKTHPIFHKTPHLILLESLCFSNTLILLDARRNLNVFRALMDARR